MSRSTTRARFRPRGAVVGGGGGGVCSAGWVPGTAQSIYVITPRAGAPVVGHGKSKMARNTCARPRRPSYVIIIIICCAIPCYIIHTGRRRFRGKTVFGGDGALSIGRRLPLLRVHTCAHRRRRPPNTGPAETLMARSSGTRWALLDFSPKHNEGRWRDGHRTVSMRWKTNFENRFTRTVINIFFFCSYV